MGVGKCIFIVSCVLLYSVVVYIIFVVFVIDQGLAWSLYNGIANQ